MEKARQATGLAKTTISTAVTAINPWRVVTSMVSLWLIGFFTFMNLVKEFWMPFYRLLFATRHPVVVRTPEDKFVAIGLDGLGYTFASNYIEIPLGAGRSLDRPRMHYIDEGDKAAAQETILCLHGVPSWSFLYRKMIPGLVEAGYRVIVPDMIGFGKSDKYVDMDNYSHEIHTFAVKHLINELGLGNNITLVGQDWGGITGLSVVKDIPERFSNLVLMNTAVPTGWDDEMLRNNPFENIQTGLPFLAWRQAVQFFGTQLPLGLFFRRYIGFNSTVTSAYTAPFPDATYKGGVAKWPLLVPFYRDDPVAQHMVEVKSCLRVWQKPALLIWGEKEVITKQGHRDLTALLPNAKHVTIKGAEHFLQETHGEQVTVNIVKFMNKKM